MLYMLLRSGILATGLQAKLQQASQLISEQQLQQEEVMLIG